jgi:hypothetical protein
MSSLSTATRGGIHQLGDSLLEGRSALVEHADRVAAAAALYPTLLAGRLLFF